MTPLRRAIRALFLTVSTVLVVVGFAAVWLLLPSPRVDTSLGIDPLNTALDRIGVTELDFQTLVVGASRETSAPPERVWALWSDPANWPRWSDGLHSSVVLSAGWSVGGTISEDIDLGFPLGTERWVQRIWHAIPGREVAWEGDCSGMRTSHVWLFEALPNGGTRVTCVGVLQGAWVAVLKPLVAASWQRRYADGLDRLLQLASPVVPPPAVVTPAPTPVPLGG
jgi:hypothetical protein